MKRNPKITQKLHRLRSLEGRRSQRVRDGRIYDFVTWHSFLSWIRSHQHLSTRVVLYSVSFDHLISTDPFGDRQTDTIGTSSRELAYLEREVAKISSLRISGDEKFVRLVHRDEDGFKMAHLFVYPKGKP